MVASGGVRPRVLAQGQHPRVLAQGQHRSEETLQRWRAVGYAVSDLIGLGIEPQVFRIDSDIRNTAGTL